MDLAGRWDLVIEQGAKWTRYFRAEDANGTARNISAYTIRMTIRPTYGSDTIIAATAGSNAVITAAWVTDGTNGEFSLTMTSAVTASLDFVRAVYDIEAYTVSDADVIRLFKGNITLDKEATT